MVVVAFCFQQKAIPGDFVVEKGKAKKVFGFCSVFWLCCVLFCFDCCLLPLLFEYDPLSEAASLSALNQSLCRRVSMSQAAPCARLEMAVPGELGNCNQSWKISSVLLPLRPTPTPAEKHSLRNQGGLHRKVFTDLLGCKLEGVLFF